MDGEIAGKFFEAVLQQARSAGLLSDEHFTVDGTLIEAWASHKSFKPMDDQEPLANSTGLDMQRRNPAATRFYKNLIEV